MIRFIGDQTALALISLALDEVDATELLSGREPSSSRRGWW